MSTFPTALFDFISSNEDGAGYFNLAKDTFFEEVLDAYHLKVAGDISALLEEEFEILFKCMVDYYCANSYPYPGLGYLWNVVDAMLKEKKLGSSEKEFYSALKDSYGSLYKIHFDKKGAFLLEDLIEPKPLFSVNDVGMDHDMVGEVIFARPLKLKKQTILADGAFIYPEELVSKITTLMKEITNQMHYRLERLSLAEILSNGYRSKEEMFAAIRKVWSKDIVAEYTNYLLCKKADTMKNEKVMH